jgi:hypothetical protein
VVAIEFLEKEYNELVNNVKEYIQERLSSDVKIMKPYDKMRDELNVDNMRDETKNRFDWWVTYFEGHMEIKMSCETPYHVEDVDGYWRLLFFQQEDLKADDLFSRYMNRLLSDLGMSFGTVDEPLSFSNFIKWYDESEYEDAHRNLNFALMRIFILRTKELQNLVDTSKKFQAYIDDNAKRTCYEMVFEGGLS